MNYLPKALTIVFTGAVLALLYYLRDNTTDDEFYRYASEAITLWQGVPDVSNEIFSTAQQEAKALALQIKQNLKDATQ